MFYSNETAIADVVVDNHECDLKISSISFEVLMRLIIYGEEESSFEPMIVISDKDESGIAPKYTEPVTKQFALNFAEINYNLKTSKKPKSPEEIFMLS